MHDFLSIAAALSDETRVRILASLWRGELCVCQVLELAGVAPSTVSKHLAVLKQAGLVESRKEGRWMHYRLAGEDAPKLVRDALAFARESLAADPRISEDARQLGCILQMTPEELCCRQRAASCCGPAAADGERRCS